MKRHNNFQKYYYGYLFDWGNIAEKKPVRNQHYGCVEKFDYDRIFFYQTGLLKNPFRGKHFFHFESDENIFQIEF